MSNESARLENLFTTHGFAWALRAFSPTTEATAYYLQKLEALKQFMGERGIGEHAPNIELIETIADNSPYKADAFIAALVSIRSSAILCAAWRIIQGTQIEELKVDFKRLNGFCLRLTLPSPSGQPEQYESTDIDDLSFVRHLIKSKSENRPMINGCHALRMSRS